ncbi:MAG: ATPase, partial [Pseudomonadota bacterium]
SDGKTVLTLRQMHPSKEQRQATISFGAVEYGGQTLEKLALHVAKVRG